MKRRWPIIALLAVAGLALLAWHGFAEARRDPVVRRASLALPRWPAGAAPVNVALLSDIHIGSAAMNEDRLRRIVRQVDALHPDLVLIAGDFIFGHAADRAAHQAPALTRALGGLRAPLGVIAALGNHDHWTGQAAVRTALAQAGVTVLVNQVVTRGPLALAGLDDPYTGHDNVPGTARRLATVAGAPLWIAHSPDVVGALPPGATLLAGHTHCGQVVLPLIGAVRPVAERRHGCGLIRERGHTIVVTGGLGTSGPPIRLGAPPDLWLLTLGPG